MGEEADGIFACHHPSMQPLQINSPYSPLLEYTFTERILKEFVPDNFYCLSEISSQNPCWAER